MEKMSKLQDLVKALSLKQYLMKQLQKLILIHPQMKKEVVAQLKMVLKTMSLVE